VCARVLVCVCAEETGAATYSQTAGGPVKQCTSNTASYKVVQWSSGTSSKSASSGLVVNECVDNLTDEEVEYKVHAFKDIREQSHTDKQVVANQASEHRSSVSKNHMIQLSSGTSSEGIQISSRMSAVTCVGNEDAASQDLPLQGTAKVPIFWVQIWLVSSGWSVSYTVCTCT
jgi:hypothetical protein